MKNNKSFAPKKRTNNFKRRNFKPSNQRSGRNGGRSGGRKKQFINPEKFINKARAFDKKPEWESKILFSDLPLKKEIKNNLLNAGFLSPSEIQEKCIPEILDGKDVLGLANTGTGKTAAFVLPTLEKLAKMPRKENRFSVLILTPTRELAQQIDEEFKKFAKGLNLYSAVCVGGVNMQKQIRDIKRQPHAIIATPGRLNDLVNRGILSLSNVSTFILDEADRMLDMGFSKEIEKIGNFLPKERQTLCFSATMDKKAKDLINKYLKEDRVEISAVKNETNDHIEQDVVKFKDRDHKIELLEGMLEQPDFEKVLIFSETKHAAQKLSDHLSKNNLPSVSIHGNKSQSQRQRALKQFKTKINIMVATDVAARGLDIDDISHVINLEQPQTYEDYVHRIGRTGRGGKSGKALTFIDEKHFR